MTLLALLLVCSNLIEKNYKDYFKNFLDKILSGMHQCHKKKKKKNRTSEFIL